MKLPSLRSFAAVLPLALALTACGGDDSDPTPAPDQGRIRAYHAAGNAEVGLKFLFDDAEKANLTYGQGSDYPDHRSTPPITSHSLGIA